MIVVRIMYGKGEIYIKKIIMLFILMLSFVVGVQLAEANNPVIKDRFTADPAAFVYDGKVYLYVGHDQATVKDSFFVMREWSVYSSSDLIDWNLEGDLPRTEFAWAKGNSAWASQAIERDGSFYWYVTVLNADTSKRGYAIGVAKSDHPAGDFKDALGQPLISSDMTPNPAHMGAEPWDDIDPTVFIDDDGQAYLYWGNTHLYYVKLKENMVELDGEIQQIEMNHMTGTFTEGPWVHKYNDHYYVSFAMNYPEEIGYAMSKHPEGPWVFQGKILDKLPNSSTSHPSIIEFEGNWYFIYHTAALPTGGEFRRSVSIEKLSYDSDGKIQKLTPSVSGVREENYRIRPYGENEKFIRYKGIKVDLLGDKQNMDENKWYIMQGLAEDHPSYISIQAENKPGYYMKRKGRRIILAKDDGTEEFKQAATFKQVSGLMDETQFSYSAFEDEILYLSVQNNEILLKEIETNSDKKNATFQIYDNQLNEVNFTQQLDQEVHFRLKNYWLLFAVILIIPAIVLLKRKKKRR